MDEIIDAHAFLQSSGSQAWSLLIATLDFVEHHWVSMGGGRGLAAATSLLHRDTCVLGSGDRFRGACDQPTAQRACVE
jgi:hypothetical protein